MGKLRMRLVGLLVETIKAQGVLCWVHGLDEKCKKHRATRRKYLGYSRIDARI